MWFHATVFDEKINLWSLSCYAKLKMSPPDLVMRQWLASNLCQEVAGHTFRDHTVLQSFSEFLPFYLITRHFFPFVDIHKVCIRTCVYKYITRSSKVGGMSKSKSFDHVLWSRIPCLFLVESSFNLNLCMKVLVVVYTHGTQQTLWTIHIKEMRGVIFENDHIRFPHRGTLKFNKPYSD